MHGCRKAERRAEAARMILSTLCLLDMAPVGPAPGIQPGTEEEEPGGVPLAGLPPVPRRQHLDGPVHQT